ncbi:hypothetical protein [Actinoplanes sp. M2I2]|uniref:hypothetical protein n=1 Tax=Actinoplanes sp. M2I2 TaxID=1734444 RepID=UPI0020215FA3|nr:hypothetical protein [Actinoplanes sp. M2I2]
MPAGFAAYARVLHPAYLGADENAVEVRWATVAAAIGREAHAGMQWVALTGSWDSYYSGRQPGLFDQPPSPGSLPTAQARHLVSALERFTTAADDCFFAVWEGIGAPAVPPDRVATLAMPGRTMLVLRGSLSDAATVSMAQAPFEQSPSLWWPADRAWCVATDIDLVSTYVGASAACIDAILAEPSLEAWPANPDDRVDGESDTRNPTPPP